MNAMLLSPPLAFVVYLILVAVLSGLGRMLAGPPAESAMKSGAYSSGEAPPLQAAAPGYRPFFVVALFFALVHLGVLMLGGSDLGPVAMLYLAGLMLALIALILG